ncbi:hypothetical protein [Clostridium saccharoperbutylacetonicum]|uniref:hypothetical protein n=1 Tax=Clostridium saccharoperbutylacetonicum TaxID=36745 RepID=UPI0039EAB062
MELKHCKVEGCLNKYYGKGYCSRHYAQFRKYGKVLERTRFDKNNIEIDKNEPSIAYMDIYNKKGEVICKVIINSDDIEKVKNTKWKAKDGSHIDSTTGTFTLGECILGTQEKGYKTIHKDGNNLNYKRDNLISEKVNRINNKFKHNTSGRKGVYKIVRKGEFTGFYMASITYNKKTIYLGIRKDFDEAVKLREEKEKELGWLNK